MFAGRLAWFAPTVAADVRAAWEKQRGTVAADPATAQLLFVAGPADVPAPPAHDAPGAAAARTYYFEADFVLRCIEQRRWLPLGQFLLAPEPPQAPRPPLHQLAPASVAHVDADGDGDTAEEGDAATDTLGAPAVDHRHGKHRAHRKRRLSVDDNAAPPAPAPTRPRAAAPAPEPAPPAPAPVAPRAPALPAAATMPLLHLLQERRAAAASAPARPSQEPPRREQRSVFVSIKPSPLALLARLARGNDALRAPHAHQQADADEGAGDNDDARHHQAPVPPLVQLLRRQRELQSGRVPPAAAPTSTAGGLWSEFAPFEGPGYRVVPRVSAI